MKKLFDEFKTKSTRIGSYAVISTAIVLAIIIIVNLIVNRLPSSWKEYDMSDSGYLNLSEETEKIVGSLQEDVHIYWIIQGTTETYLDVKMLGSLLDRYEDLSDHLKVEKKDPDRYPGFLKSYELSSITNNSLIVQCGDRYRYLDSAAIFLSVENGDGSYDTEFDGEGLLTTAINYVVTGKTSILYELTGHGESGLEDAYKTALGRINCDTKELTLIGETKIPEDCDILLVNVPSKDLSNDELKLLEEYVDNGGRLIMVTLPAETEVPNLNELAAYFGMKRVEGMVVESKSAYYAGQFGAYALLPTLQKHTITEPLVNKKYPVLFPICSGLQDIGTSDDVVYTPLAQSSAESFSKIAGYAMETYEKEDGDIDGPFDVAAIVEKGEGKLVWFTSAGVTNDTMNQLVSGSNQDLFLNTVSYLNDQEESISIHAKKITNETLITSSTDTLIWSIVFIGVVPLIFLILGIVMIIKRRNQR